jgi:riboflavin kinase/FMN adenylyltransferase
MITVNSIAELSSHGINRIVLTCGIFDGIHKGHQSIIKQLKSCAENYQATAVLLSFNPHPRKFLAPESAPKLMFSHSHKAYLLAKYGIEAFVILSFDKMMASLDAKDFIHNLTSNEGVDLKAICVGKQWRFGKYAQGDINLLRELSKRSGFEVCPVSESLEEETKISSTAIRNHLEKGELSDACGLLGRAFSIYGKVHKGRGIASQKFNYPTANLLLENELYPPLGIYAVSVRTEAQISLPGILYLGNAATDCLQKPEKPFAEVHIFDFNQDIYDQYLEVELLSFIRDDSKFDSEKALIEQIEKDIDCVKKFHQNRRVD